MPLVATVEFTTQQFLIGLGSTAAFGLLGIVLLLFGFKLFEFVTPKLDVERKLQEGNVAVAVAVAALLLAIAAVLVAVVLPS